MSPRFTSENFKGALLNPLQRFFKSFAGIFLWYPGITGIASELFQVVPPGISQGFFQELQFKKWLQKIFQKGWIFEGTPGNISAGIAGEIPRDNLLKMSDAIPEVVIFFKRILEELLEKFRIESLKNDWKNLWMNV